MLGLPPSVRIFFAAEPTDMRKGTLPVGVVIPCTRPNRAPVASLRKAATFTRNLREGALRTMGASSRIAHVAE